MGQRSQVDHSQGHQKGHVLIALAQIVSGQFVLAQIVFAKFVSGTKCIINKLYLEQIVSGNKLC